MLSLRDVSFETVYKDIPGIAYDFVFFAYDLMVIWSFPHSEKLHYELQLKK